MLKILKAFTWPVIFVLAIILYVVIIVNQVRDSNEKERLDPTLHKSHVKEECLVKVK